MFQFPAFASYPYVFESKIPYHNAWKPKPTLQSVWIFQAFKVGFPIRRSMDQSSFAAPHGFSQRITSFIACACQGIHQMPLRHLIVLIANAHPRTNPAAELAEKTSFSRSVRWPAVKPPIICRRLSVSGDDTQSISTRPVTEGYGPSRARLRTGNPNKSSLHDFIQNRQEAEARCKLFFSANDTDTRRIQLVEPDGIEPTTPCLQSRCSPS